MSIEDYEYENLDEMDKLEARILSAVDKLRDEILSEFREVNERFDALEGNISEIKDKLNAIDVFYIGGIQHLGPREGPFKAA